MLRKLPASCVALEIDTSLKKGPEMEPHLCPLIARLLPQLKYLRLSLTTICPDIFANISGGTTAAQCQHCGLPSPESGARTSPLEVLVISCGWTDQCNTPIQAHDPLSRLPYLLANSAHAHVTGGAMPNIRTLHIATETEAVGNVWTDGRLHYSNFVRFDCVRGCTVVMPHRVIRMGHGVSEISFMSALGDEELIAEMQVLANVAEGRLWIALKHPVGARLPAEMAASAHLLVVEQEVSYEWTSFEWAQPS